MTSLRNHHDILDTSVSSLARPLDDDVLEGRLSSPRSVVGERRSASFNMKRPSFNDNEEFKNNHGEGASRRFSLFDLMEAGWDHAENNNHTSSETTAPKKPTLEILAKIPSFEKKFISTTTCTDNDDDDDDDDQSAAAASVVAKEEEDLLGNSATTTETANSTLPPASPRIKKQAQEEGGKENQDDEEEEADASLARDFEFLDLAFELDFQDSINIESCRMKRRAKRRSPPAVVLEDIVSFEDDNDNNENGDNDKHQQARRQQQQQGGVSQSSLLTLDEDEISALQALSSIASDDEDDDDEDETTLPSHAGGDDVDDDDDDDIDYEQQEFEFSLSDLVHDFAMENDFGTRDSVNLKKMNRRSNNNALQS